MNIIEAGGNDIFFVDIGQLQTFFHILFEFMLPIFHYDAAKQFDIICVMLNSFRRENNIAYLL